MTYLIIRPVHYCNMSHYYVYLIMTIVRYDIMYGSSIIVCDIMSIRLSLLLGRLLCGLTLCDKSIL